MIKIPQDVEMNVREELNVALCHFMGGYGIARLDDEGVMWTYKVISTTLDKAHRLVTFRGESEATQEAVFTFGHREGFKNAMERLEPC